MPSPFPGMDPYLEAPAVWPGVHANLITRLQHLLVAQLRPRYFVDVEQRVYVLSEDDPATRELLVPDLAVTPAPPPGPRPAPTSEGGTPQVLLMIEDEVEVTERYLVVRDVEERAVVTVIEVLSPTNKAAGSRGRDQYLAKRRELLRSPTHLVEIDLLRRGQRIPSVQALPPGDYYAHVSRAALRPRGEVYTWTVREPAPRLAIPLRAGEPDVVLDLPEAIASTYELAGYDLRLDYGRDPDPPLSGEDAAWADELLRARGARS
ncbi:MAG: DUF4058 family protein [Planctomycetota bacterium]